MHHFSDIYLQVRQKEHRIYTDEEVLELPYLKVHTHSKEWKIRAYNAELLRNYMQKLYPQGVNIVEIGSGNGWLVNFLSQIPDSHITGTEINDYELEQAKRLFKKSTLHFEAKDISEIDFSKYNVVIFAASVQYFENPQRIFDHVFSQNPDAEIICIDSFWYKNDHEAQQAKQRSKKYYTELGYPEMAEYYYHHTFEILKPYHFSILNNGFMYKMRLKWSGLPFMPCISIKQ